MGEPPLFDAFLKAAQYIARIKLQQDLWEHAGRLIVTHFPPEWVAFGDGSSGGTISVHSCTSADPSLTHALAGGEVRALVGDVLESGFLVSQVIPTSTSMMTAFLPIIAEYQTQAVMLVGHEVADAIPTELLNVYLALAGLVGTALERLQTEEELTRHRAYLEELVGDRTRELSKAKEQTELILHCVGEGICGLDLEGRITFVNPFAVQSLGWDESALLGRDAHSAFHYMHSGGSPYPAEECAVRASIMGERTGLVSGEEFLRRDGTAFPVEFSTAPITQDGQRVGAVLVFRDITERTRAEQELAAQNEELQAAHEEAAGLLEQQRALFQRLQEALLDIPRELPGVGFGHLYRSATEEAQIGGDFYDVFQARNGQIGLLIGDVCGHGVQAARIATLVKDTVHAFAHHFRRPHLVLRETNKLLIERNLPGFVTAFLGLLDPESGVLVYSSAGHPPPLLKVGALIKPLESIGSPLGVFADAEYGDRELQVAKGSLILLYTDGITEMRRGDVFFGEDGLTMALHRLGGTPVQGLPSLLLDQALLFSGGRLDDDAALLAVKYLGTSDLLRAPAVWPGSRLG